ncbi:MAG: hypothetical protein HOC33_04980 [Alphaproteobacteria bacterium]|nr:hypothetical protein [Alphaproteobacteria bacterium]MBT4543181.1 hypothetical protein [Alphaproteobacteria bacterium]
MGRYNWTLCQERMDKNIFETIEEAQEQAARCLWTSNHERLNIAISGATAAMKLEVAA